MKTLVVYYSNTGSNKYLATKISHALQCDIETIRPRMNVFPLLLLFSALKTGPGIKKLKHNVNDYDRIILCGPIWMGTFVSPLRDFVGKYRHDIKKLCFATCCGSNDAKKDDTFGYATVFPKVKRMLGDTCIHCEAFPIGLVLPDDKQDDGDAVMKTRLSDSLFGGLIEERFTSFIQKLA
jgi:flavodoxin